MKPVLSVKNLAVDFKTERGTSRAVNGISFDVFPGETVGIVGESGCGKSVTSLAVLGLIPSPPGTIAGGEILFKDRNLVGLSESDYRKIRGKDISMIFQEPLTALNPVLRVGTQMVDIIRRHKDMGPVEARKEAIQFLEKVGIPAPEKRIDEYPHQLSGGMRQRVMIAMALLCGPELLLADEPTTALDVTTQAQVMNEMNRLQKEFGMAMVLVTHDMGVVAETCQRVVVMYCGEIIETGPVKEIFKNPQHPYTRGLLESIPQIRDEKLKRLPTIEGTVPDLFQLPKGCRFQNRCELAVDKCVNSSPALEGEGHQVACYRAGEQA